MMSTAGPWPKELKREGVFPEYVQFSEGKWQRASPGTVKGFCYRARTDLVLVVDGSIVDLNRIKLPAGVRIDDRRFPSVFRVKGQVSDAEGLDFVMLPAASLKGRVIDGKGWPVPSLKFNMIGEKLYPSSSVLENFTTDENGQFSRSTVPPQEYWFNLGHGHSLQSTSRINMGAAKNYEVVLRYTVKKFSVESLTVPSSAPD